MDNSLHTSQKKYYVLYVYLTCAFLFLNLNKIEQQKISQIYLTTALFPLYKTINVINDFFNVRSENERLKTEIAFLKLKHYDTYELIEENKRLAKLLDFKNNYLHIFDKKNFVTAHVIAINPHPDYNSLLIDRGNSAGLEKNMIVMNEHGLIGKIFSVTPFSAIVFLLNDKNHYFSVLLQKSRIKSSIHWKGANVFELLDATAVDNIPLDDFVITSGLGGVYPPGIPVGRVIRAEKASDLSARQNVLVSSFVDFSKIEDVLVLMKKDEYRF